MRALSLARWILVGLITIALATPALVVTVGDRLIVSVDGESMTPTYQVGDIILVREPEVTDLVVGNVVTAIDSNGDYYTHRIKTVNDDGSVSLQGDGNTAPDPGSVTIEQLRGVVEMHLAQPWANLVVQLQEWPLRICLLAIILGLALIPLKSRRDSAPTGAAAPVVAAVAPLPVAAATESARRRRGRSSGRRSAAAAAEQTRVKGKRSAKAEIAAAPTPAEKPVRGRRRRLASKARGVEGEPVQFRSTYSAAEPTSSVEASIPVAAVAGGAVALDDSSPSTGPVVELTGSPVSSVAVESSPFSPLSAALITGHEGAARAHSTFVLDRDVDEVDEVDNVANLVTAAPHGADASGYSITVVDGPDGQPRVRISLDLDSSTLAAAIAVAAPSFVPSSGGAEATVFSAPQSSAQRHAAAGLAPVLEFAGGETPSPVALRPRHGRRRA